MAWTEEDFQCQKNERLLVNRKDAEIAILNRRKEKGCGVLNPNRAIQVGEYEFHSCLCHGNFRHPSMDFILGAYNSYRVGLLPFEGAYADQPAQIMELLQLIQMLHDEREAAMIKKQEASSKKGK